MKYRLVWQQKHLSYFVTTTIHTLGIKSYISLQKKINQTKASACAQIKDKIESSTITREIHEKLQANKQTYYKKQQQVML